MLLQNVYLKQFNVQFSKAAAQTGTAFVPARSFDLERIFSIQHERTVNNDNTVRLANMILQIQPTLWRSTLAGCRVIVLQQLDRTFCSNSIVRSAATRSYVPHQLWSACCRTL
jgi:hypothetical protein